ncbi:hypothetical protein NA57DRAFT_43679 [Rhizodiscina lignyota]|uniref:Nonribosomal peptide synthetase 12 n=1 Tax=Rhizodiscina lignyota TaxID=1504668 RepID=A0A9P4M621_9PEZI|nr:hypothetical protein NA57DRAFT_43679 [Rhizodiscina lignyota]
MLRIIAPQQVSCISTSSILECEKGEPSVSTSKDYWRFHLLRRLPFSVYQWLFGIVFIGNMIPFVWILYRFATLRELGLDCVLTAAATNFFALVAVRNEHLVNLFYGLANVVARNSPPFTRHTFLSMIHHYGGIHSGCAVAGILWYCLFLTATTCNFQNRQPVDTAIIGITWIVWLLLISMLVFAHPTLRARLHDQFEVVHRFAGWTVIGLFWTQTMLVIATFAKAEKLSFGSRLVRTQSFWLLVLITALLVYPWLRLRKRSVRIERISSHVVRFHFDYATAEPCMAVKLSHAPLRENHAFACIPAPDRGSGYSVLVSNAGDWTGNIIRNPPEKLWVREIPMRGVLWNATMFSRVVIVATGSGIGPCLGLFNGCPDLDCRIIWSTKSPEKTYGQGIIGSVLRADPSSIIVDTEKSGRPDLHKMAYTLYETTQSEAVFVISNQKLTKAVVGGLRGQGVSAYGPIWDS